MVFQASRQTRNPSTGDTPQKLAAIYCPKNINYLSMQPTTYYIVTIMSDFYDTGHRAHTNYPYFSHDLLDYICGEVQTAAKAKLPYLAKYKTRMFS